MLTCSLKYYVLAFLTDVTDATLTFNFDMKLIVSSFKVI